MATSLVVPKTVDSAGVDTGALSTFNAMFGSRDHSYFDALRSLTQPQVRAVMRSLEEE